MGYDCRWGVISAADVDAPHLRERIWISAHLADPDGREEMADTVRQREQRFVAWSLDPQKREGQIERQDRSRSHGLRRWPAEPGVGRVVDGLAYRAHRIRALGNGQVSRVAAVAWTVLSGERK
ncbi:hypothetical protein [Variovorax sp. PAMC 28711]|uniref:hypothetical protein n=1 Tax=Variovorax sp. PAMC 28711 TaxID=1795631 RepID=UPI001AF00523